MRAMMGGVRVWWPLNNVNVDPKVQSELSRSEEKHQTDVTRCSACCRRGELLQWAGQAAGGGRHPQHQEGGAIPSLCVFRYQGSWQYTRSVRHEASGL